MGLIIQQVRHELCMESSSCLIRITSCIATTRMTCILSRIRIFCFASPCILPRRLYRLPHRECCHAVYVYCHAVYIYHHTVCTATPFMYIATLYILPHRLYSNNQSHEWRWHCHKLGRFVSDRVSTGAGGDSFYELLLKQYLLRPLTLR